MAKVTSDILEAHLNCTFKANLKLGGQQGDTAEHETMLAGIREEIRLGALETILNQHSTDLDSFFSTISRKVSEGRLGDALEFGETVNENALGLGTDHWDDLDLGGPLHSQVVLR